MTHAYPEIAEIDEEKQKELVDTREEDAPPPKFYPHCFCPSNELSYKILFDLLDEIIEVCNPSEYVHMGHDEVYEIGVCPRCKGKDPASLFAEDVNKLHAYLAARGLKMMIWSDMLQPVTKYLTPAAINMIPKDIVCLDFIWYFHLDKDIEDNLLEKGFNVIFGNLYSSHFPRYESRIVKDGIMGAQISAWVATAEKELQQEGKIYDFMRTAEMFWDASYSEKYSFVYDKLLSDIMPRVREGLKNVKYPSLEEGARMHIPLENEISFPPKLPIKQITSFEVQDEYSSLIFWHTMARKMTRLPWTEHDVVGRYVLTYEGGETEEIPLTSCGNIGYWNRRVSRPIKHPLYRHDGYITTYYSDAEWIKNEQGDDVTYYKYEHVLPSDKKLVSVRLEQDPKFDAGIILKMVEAVVKK
jgi:hexosaminidase